MFGLFGQQEEINSTRCQDSTVSWCLSDMFLEKWWVQLSHGEWCRPGFATCCGRGWKRSRIYILDRLPGFGKAPVLLLRIESAIYCWCCTISMNNSVSRSEVRRIPQGYIHGGWWVWHHNIFTWVCLFGYAQQPRTAGIWFQLWSMMRDLCKMERRG